MLLLIGYANICLSTAPRRMTVVVVLLVRVLVLLPSLMPAVAVPLCLPGEVA